MPGTGERMVERTEADGTVIATVRLAAVVAAFVLAGAAVAQTDVAAQGQDQGDRPARAAAPIDLVGTWVSVVTEDWRWRMVTPPRGDYASIPLTDEGRKVADSWDPAADDASGNACKAYGAPAIMRVPGRVRISWQDDTTLRIETDAGEQTRLLPFGDAEPPSGDAGWQGRSRAEWRFAIGARIPTAAAAGRTGVIPDAPGRAAGDGPRPGAGTLRVVTTGMRPGYLRKNGVPYSEDAVLTEYFNRHSERDGTAWFTVVTEVVDPQYLTMPFVTSTHFRREPDDSGWRPTPCTAR
ncbi:MAG: hypothetical protein HY657_03595 [Acidobacteria bacterium]|nr:hypothetical protein [Acidobacteriota bacterium]